LGIVSDEEQITVTRCHMRQTTRDHIILQYITPDPRWIACGRPQGVSAGSRCVDPVRGL